MPDLTEASAAMLFDANRYATEGLRIDDEDDDNAARCLVSQGLAVWDTGSCAFEVCDCEVRVIRLTPAGVAELSRIAKEL